MNYVGEVTEIFRSRCGEMNILGPMDYVLIAEWEKRGIPLSVVAAAVDEMMEFRRDEASTINSVGYFQEHIKQAFRAWLQADGAAA